MVSLRVERRASGAIILVIPITTHIKYVFRSLMQGWFHYKYYIVFVWLHHSTYNILYYILIICFVYKSNNNFRGNACALTVHVHSQSEGVRPHNSARCNLVLPTVITNDISNSQTCSVDSEPCVSDRCTTPGQCNVVTGGRWVGVNGKGDCELSPFYWCCSGIGGRELRGIWRAEAGTCTSIIVGHSVQLLLLQHAPRAHTAGAPICYHYQCSLECEGKHANIQVLVEVPSASHH